MSDFSLTLDMASVATLEAQLLRKLQRAQIYGGVSIREQSEELMAQSQALVPVDTGTLLASGFVEDIELGGDSAVRIGYNGSNINPKSGKPVSSYLMEVHERLDRFHPRGQAKFFEIPILQYVPKFELTTAAALAKALTG